MSKKSILKEKENLNLPKIKNSKSVNFENISGNTSSIQMQSKSRQNKSNQKNEFKEFSSEFYKRNYDMYISKINRRNKYYNSKLMTETELNTLLYKLKSYYSDVITLNNKKEESLMLLKQILNKEQFKLNQVIEFQDIELPEEKISVRNFNELKLTKNEVEIQLKNLLKEKQNLDELLKNAEEYFKTIEYMCEDEKNRFMEIKKETNVIEERINNVNQYQRIINYNLGKNKLKNEGEKEINGKLKKDIDLVEKVNENQKKKNELLDRIIYLKGKKIEELKRQLIELKKQNKKHNNSYQNDIQKQIEKVKENEENQKINEKKSIEIIFCLHLIQNYFINEENFDRQNMQSSKEYKLLSNNKFEINFNKKEKKNLKNSKLFNSQILAKNEINNNENTKKEKKSDFEPIDINKNLAKKSSLNNYYLSLKIDNIEKNIEAEKKPNSKDKNDNNSNLVNLINKIINDRNKEANKNNNKNRNKHNNNIEKETEEKKIKEDNNSNIDNTNKMNKTKNSFRTVSAHSNNINNNITKKSFNSDNPSLDELREKFESLDINKETLFNYNSKLTSKLNFFKTQFDHYHAKELLLEEKKSLFTKKAIQVISDDFLTFKQLTKINPEIKEFLKKNLEIIQKIKHENKKDKLNEINNKITSSNPINDKMKENSKSLYQIDDQLNNNSNMVISASHDIILSNKNFFMKCNDYLKQIINTIDVINNMDKKENEKKKNNDNNNNNNENEQKEDKEEKNETNSENNSSTKIKVDPNFTEIFVEESNKLENLLKTMDEEVINNKKNFVNYLKDLINFSQKDEELKKIFNLDELNNDLLYHFYKDKEGNKIKKTFYNQFQLKRFPELKKIFNHFTEYIEPTIEHINKIINIIKDTENNSNIKTMISLKKNRLLLKRKETGKLNFYNADNISSDNNEKTNLRYGSQLTKSRTAIGFGIGTTSSQKDTSFSELEFMGGGKIDEDDLADNEIEKKEKKIIRKKVNSQEENIVNKLYSPFLEKTYYLRQLNNNMKGIKSMTTYDCKASHTLRKRNGEVDIITHQMMIYNNPLINPNKLANPTYNSLVQLAISNQNLHKKDKRYRSTFNLKSKDIQK